MKTINLFFLGMASVVSLSAQAIEIKSNEWNFNFNGYVNTHAVYVSCDRSGVEVAGNALLCTGENATSISNGYSPASFIFSAQTQKKGFDISATLAVEPGTTDNAAFNGNGDGEAYRAFFTVGNNRFGTIKAGRDYGIFGIDIILEDMSLGSVGAPILVKSPLNTTLGGAGYGYIFVDRLSQITYSYESENGLSGSVGIFQPLDLVSFGGNGYVGDSGSSQPGIHGKLRFDFSSGFISSTFLRQAVDTINNNYISNGFDLTSKISIKNTSLVVSGFKAKGLGHYGLFIDAADINGDPRDSHGWFTQISHQFSAVKVGINYGESNVDLTQLDARTQVKNQKKLTLGLYYEILDGVTTSVELSDIQAENHQNDKLENQAVSFGFAFAF